ncbi:hypothetical protein LINPERPRIM_LOCUS21141 [Linum perenne]
MRKQEKQLRPLSVSWRIQRLIITLARSMLLVEPLMRKSILVVFAVLVLDRYHHKYDSSIKYDNSWSMSLLVYMSLKLHGYGQFPSCKHTQTYVCLPWILSVPFLQKHTHTQTHIGLPRTRLGNVEFEGRSNHTRRNDDML